MLYKIENKLYVEVYKDVYAEVAFVKIGESICLRPVKMGITFDRDIIKKVCDVDAERNKFINKNTHIKHKKTN